MEIFTFYEIGKKRGNQKRVVCARGGSHSYLCVLLRSGNTLRLMPSGAPSSGECTQTGTSPSTESTVHFFFFVFFGASLAKDFSDILSEKLPQARRYSPAWPGNFHTSEVTCQAVISI
jgi:hypothetical protein